MQFRHSEAIWKDFPRLVPGVLYAEGLYTEETCADRSVEPRVAKYTEIARERLAGSPEAGLPEIKAWRRAFSQLGLRPTQYRCAAESLLRRFRKDGTLPRIHPLIDLCNVISLAFAIPVAVFDVAKMSGDLEVRYATGDEMFETFSGATERPDPGEVIFADAAGYAHARRWTNRQSGRSAVSETTARVLIVAEALHDTAPEDVRRLISAVGGDLCDVWSSTPASVVLTHSAPAFRC